MKNIVYNAHMIMNEKCRPNGPSPVWQLYKSLQDELMIGVLEEGKYMHSTRKLMRKYNVSDKTVHRALGLFHDIHDALHLERGKGLRINPGTLEHVREERTKRFFDNLESLILDAKAIDLDWNRGVDWQDIAREFDEFHKKDKTTKIFKFKLLDDLRNS